MAAAKPWHAVVSHRFMDGLWSGKLDPAVLGDRLVQGQRVLDATLALMGATVAAADRPASRVVHARRLGLVAGPETGYLSRAMDVLDVPLDDRTHPNLHPATRELLDLLHVTRRGGDYVRCVTLLLASDWLHLEWATRPDAEPPTEPLRREWIELHRGAAAEAWVSFLRVEVDRLAAALDDAGRASIAALFTRTVELELGLLDAAYT